MKINRICALLVVGILSSMAFTGCPASNGSGTIGRIYYLNNTWDAGHRIAATADGGYFITGQAATDKTDVTRVEVMAVKLSVSRDVKWNTVLPGLYPAGGPGPSACGLPTEDGGAILTGLTERSSGDTAAAARLRIARLDAEQNVVWDHTYGGDKQWIPKAVIRTQDGAYIVAGTEKSGFTYSAFLLKINGTGEMLWFSIPTPLAQFMVIKDVVEMPSAELVAVGLLPADDYDRYGANAALLRTTSNGNALSWTQYQDENEQIAERVSITPDGGLVLAGTTQKTYPERPVVYRTDGNGNLLWQRDDMLDPKPSDHYEVWGMVVDGRGRIVVVGVAERVQYVANFFPLITDEGYIMQLDSAGNLNWYKSLGRGFVYDVALTDKGNYITTGTTGSHLQVIQVDPNGNVL